MAGGGLSLERWANFYQITSAAAATLVGLLFIVITLAAEHRPSHEVFKIRLYMTPVVASFGSVLAVGVLLTIPDLTPFAAAVCCCLLAAAGLIYMGLLGLHRHPKGRFYETRSDVVRHVALPFAAYAVLGVGGVLLFHRPRRGLDILAAAVVLLLGTALRNSWAIAVAVTTSRGARSD